MNFFVVGACDFRCESRDDGLLTNVLTLYKILREDTLFQGQRTALFFVLHYGIMKPYLW